MSPPAPVGAVRAALGVAPGSEQAERVGIAAIGAEPVTVRVGRAVAVALSDEALDESVGVDVGPDSVVVTGGNPVDRGIVAARLGVALWGEGFGSAVEAAARRGLDAVTVRIWER